jgi:hypothetical protein
VQKRQLGWKLCLVASLFPSMVGLLAYLTSFLLSIRLAPDQAWRFITIPFGFRFDDVARFDRDLAAVFRSMVHIGMTNVHNAGVLLAVLTVCGIRAGHRWAWLACLYGFAWGGINDSIAAIDLYRSSGILIPLPILSATIGLIGLWLSRDSVHHPQEVEQ